MECINSFHRTKTPMGTVPISVIHGFKYPLSPGEMRSQACYTQTSPLMKIKESIWPSSLGSSNHSVPRSKAEKISYVCYKFCVDWIY